MPSSLLVALQFGLIGALVVSTRLPAAAAQVALPLLLLGLATVLGVWTLGANRWGNFNIRPEVKSGARLITTGPYRWVRHPMYTTVLLAMAALLVTDAGVVRAALYLALMVVLAIKAQREEDFLHAAFAEYGAYAARTRRFIPLLW